MEKPLRVLMEDDSEDWITLDSNRAFKLQRFATLSALFLYPSGDVLCDAMESSDSCLHQVIERSDLTISFRNTFRCTVKLRRFRHGGIGRSVRTVQSVLALAKITHGSPHAVPNDFRDAVPWDFRGVWKIIDLMAS